MTGPDPNSIYPNENIRPATVAFTLGILFWEDFVHIERLQLIFNRFCDIIGKSMRKLG